MRVLVAPDGFGGSLTAVEAAAAIAAGWRRGAPRDEGRGGALVGRRTGFRRCARPPCSGPRRVDTTVRDPLLRPVRAHLLLEGTTAYVESADACGLHLVDATMRRPRCSRRPAWGTCSAPRSPPVQAPS